MVVVHSNGKGSTASVGRWGDGEMGRWGDGGMGRWGVWEKLKNIYPHHYHAGLPKILQKCILREKETGSRIQLGYLRFISKWYYVTKPGFNINTPISVIDRRRTRRLLENSVCRA